MSTFCLTHPPAGYHTHENAFLAFLYNASYVTGKQFALYFKPVDGIRASRMNVLPDFVKPGAVEVGGRQGQGCSTWLAAGACTTNHMCRRHLAGLLRFAV
jgi:hypothetical protein